MTDTKLAPGILAGLTDEALEAELAARKLRQTSPQPLDNPDWGKLKAYVMEKVKELAKPDGYVKDLEHYLFEEVLETIYGTGIWVWWNHGPGNRG